MTSRGERFTTPSLVGIRLHALHWGEDKPQRVVLLHGGGANAHWWDHIAPALATHFHVVALDFRGHGDADHPDETRVGAFNDDLEALLAHLGSRRVALIGHSMGGGVALDHAAHHDDVSALVAVDVSRGASRRSRRVARLALALRRTYETREEAIRRYRFLPASAHASETLRARIASHSVREEADGRFGFKFDPRWFSLPSRPRPNLSEIKCPTLVVRGSESPMLTAEGADELVNELSDGRVVVTERAGHHVHLDQPDHFLDAVLPFLTGILPEHAAGGVP
jgi:pimeloyl-ACP methyl ester carboxylesterase